MAVYAPMSKSAAQGSERWAAVTSISVAEEAEPQGNPNRLQASGVGWLIL